MSSARRRLAHALTAALVALGLLAGAAPAGAETPAPAPPPAELVVAPQDPVIDEGDAEVSFSVLVRNPGEQVVPSGDIELRLSAQPMETAGELEAQAASASLDLAQGRIGETAPGSEQAATITVPRDRLPSPSSRGVHAVLASFTPDDPGGSGTPPDVLTAFSPVVWGGPAAPDIPPAGAANAESTVRLSLIVPLVLPSDIRTLPTRSQLAELVPTWEGLLAQARLQQATLAIDPRIVAGIRAYGGEAPENARQFLDGLERSALPSFLLQFADADPAAQAALGFTSLLAPSSLDFVSRFGSVDATLASDEGNSAPAPSGTPNPSDGGGSGPDDPGNADPEAPTLPTLEELLDWPQQQSVAWPAEGAVDETALELLRVEGIDSVVLRSDNVTDAGAPRARLPRGSALITDAALGDAARAALSAPTETERAGGAARLSAQLAFAAQAGSGGALLGLDRGAVGDSEDPAQLLELLSSLAWVVPTPVAEQPEGTASLRASGTSEKRVALLRAAASRESSVTELGAVLVNPEYLSGYQRARLLELFATRYASAGVDFEGVAAQFRERDAQLLDGVRVITTENTQLVGNSTRVPVQLRNALPFDAQVTVQADPSSAALSVTERRFTDVLVPAEANERVLVPVLSRVSSGESGLVVTVSAATGEPTVSTSTLPISIRSTIETIALWALGSLAALLLVFGIWRSVRRRRQGGASATSSPAE
ncbi:DUF6049 family protein [Leucobacter sp. wl10]|uniref:DUF6049 family protein n=1 Tax=Leucobacter sp. wl10 TaxID=2304677 RepID=UPI000E5BE623|nr:DUF6049 family protein [Leucobacter sp. wl10]RGE17346.1 hypothetical protein D1J51_15920 [Leucobacter sp. wl10]